MVGNCKVLIKLKRESETMRTVESLFLSAVSLTDRRPWLKCNTRHCTENLVILTFLIAFDTLYSHRVHDVRTPFADLDVGLAWPEWN